MNSSFPAVNLEVRLKYLAGRCLCVWCGVEVFNSQTIKCNVGREREWIDFYSFRMFSWLLFQDIGVVWVL